MDMNENRMYDSTLEDRLLELLQTSWKLALTQMDSALDEAGLSAAKIWALMHLISSDGAMGMTQLADCIGSGKSNATQIVDRLEAERLVRRVPHPEDRRSVLVEVTEEGQRRYEAGVQIRKRVARDMLATLTHDEQRQLIGLLERLAAQS
jgi:DNA-binding MarR family transcriptional regulator